MFRLAAAFAGVIATTQALDVYANNRVMAWEDEEDDEELPEKVEFSFQIPDIGALTDKHAPGGYTPKPHVNVVDHVQPALHVDPVPEGYSSTPSHSHTPAAHTHNGGFTTR